MLLKYRFFLFEIKFVDSFFFFKLQKDTSFYIFLKRFKIGRKEG